MDQLFIVVEPNLTSLETGRKIARLATDLGLKKIAVVANKIHGKEEYSLVEQAIDFGKVAGFLPHHPEIARAAMQPGKRVELWPDVIPHLKNILKNLDLTDHIPDLQ